MSADPTELGTFYNATKCTKCPAGKGYFLSEEPLKGSDAPWKCNSCGNSAPYRECVVPIETTVFEEIQTANDEEAYEKVLEKHAGPSLHPNHWLMMDCRQEIIKRMFNSVPSIKEPEKLAERSKKFLEYCKSLQQVTNVFYPGHNRIKGKMS